MNRRLLFLVTSILATVLAAGGAFAQSDSVLQRYDLAVENLEIAVQSVPGDGAQARDELERALNALLTLSANSSSPNLVGAMEKTFERTRVAIENQSRTDMAVQTAVLRGGFARLVMDSAFLTAAEGDHDLARARLLHLATSLSFTAEAQEELAAATTTDELRLAFEAGSAEAVVADLQVAERLLDSDRPAAYQNLARAYGESLLVQDSPRSDSDLNAQLVAAAAGLVDDDVTAVREAVAAAELQLSRLASSARGGVVAEVPALPAAEDAPGTAGVAPSELPSLPLEESASSNAGATEAGVAATETADTAEAANQANTATEGIAAVPSEAHGLLGDGQTSADNQAADNQTSGDAVNAEAQAGAPLPLLDSAAFNAAVQLRMAELEAERHHEELDRLTRELTMAGMPATQANISAEQLQNAGHLSLESALAVLDAGAGRAVAAQRLGDEAAAREAVAALSTDYHQLVAPLLRGADPAVADATEKLFESTAQRPGRTLGDVTLMAAQMSAVRGALEGRSPSLGHEIELTVDNVWSNWTRVSVMIILGLLAIVPLALLNLAFGGGNRNWRYIGSALFLLLVPVFYEALTSLATLISAFVDWPWLATVATWSMFNSVTGYVVWALLVLIALLLATAGFYGICVQFGLLGGSRSNVVAPSGTAVETKRPSGHTTIDWDEEF